MGQDTVVAIATPAGQGGLAVLRVSGPQAYEVAEQVFVPHVQEKPVRTARGFTAQYGLLVDGGQKIDDGIALFFRAPRSYTGEDVVELSCHGGETVSRLVLQACLKAGASPAGPGEFTKRAVLNDRMPLTAAEAVMDVISASSANGAYLAGTVLGGALHAQISEMKQELMRLAAHLAAYTDYPEEDVERLDEAEFVQVAKKVETRLAGWVKDYDKGLMLRRGVDTVIVGSPNVGKSTLFNLMSGFQRAIVTPVAGTTRDIVREQVRVGGVVLNLSDTAGLHDTPDEVEREGIRRSRQAMDEADLIIAVFDASAPLAEGQATLARECAGRRALAIVNKSDLGERLDISELTPYFKKLVVVSAAAAQQQALENIDAAVAEVLGVNALDTNAVTLGSQRQLAAAVAAHDALADAAAALQNGLGLDAAGVCLQDAIAALAALTGEDATEKLLDEVFSTYCVGK